MRTTQYIGLTDQALDFLRRNGKLIKDVVITTGMFDEEVSGGVWELVAPKGPNKALYAKECVQMQPWSSGPMIFTCLELILVKDSGQEVKLSQIFQWVVNPEIQGEFDQKKGQLWI